MGICLCTDRHAGAGACAGGRPGHAAANCAWAFKQPAQPAGAPPGGGGGGARLYQLVPVCADAVTELRDPSPIRRGGCGAGAGAGGKGKALCAAVTRARPFGEEWLGKDTAGSLYELEFYDAVLQLRGLGGGGARGAPEGGAAEEAGAEAWRVFDYLVSYHGLLRGQLCHATAGASAGAASARERPLDLMVFRSPLEGFARPRMLHLEVGPRTSALQYRRGSEIEAVAFARQEGVRVEGFLAPPQSVPSEDPTHDARGWVWGEGTQRRAKRMALQRLRLGIALATFADLRDAILEERLWSGGPAGCYRISGGRVLDSFMEDFLGPAEYAELVLFTAIRELASLLRACRDVPVPQKWVGSSLGLLAEVGAAPPRRGDVDPQEWVAARLKVRLFDWGRSHVSSEVTGRALSPVEQADNETMWRIYTDSLARIVWEASRLYFHSFCAPSWRELRVELFEAGPRGEESLIGFYCLRLDAADVSSFGPRVVPVALAPAAAGGGAPLVSLAIACVACPQPSRFAAVWRVRVDSARCLPGRASVRTAAGAAAPGAGAPAAAAAATPGAGASGALASTVAGAEPRLGLGAPAALAGGAASTSSGAGAAPAAVAANGPEARARAAAAREAGGATQAPRSFFVLVAARGDAPPGAPGGEVFAAHRTRPMPEADEGSVWREEFEFPMVRPADATDRRLAAALCASGGSASGADAGAGAAAESGHAGGANAAPACGIAASSSPTGGLAGHMPPPETLAGPAPDGPEALLGDARAAATSQLAFTAWLLGGTVVGAGAAGAAAGDGAAGGGGHAASG